MATMIYGDIHGFFPDFLEKYNEYRNVVDTCVLAGDQCPWEPLSNITRQMGCTCFFILGNHDGDQSSYLENHLSCWENHIHCRVVESAEGIRIAGISGTFEEEIWYPPEKPRWLTREQFRKFCKTQPRGTVKYHLLHNHLPKRFWPVIFPEDVDKLKKLQSDVLVCHEAPSCHSLGFDIIDEIAEAMNVSVIVHGHHHESYQGKTRNKIKVIGLNMEDFILLDRDMVWRWSKGKKGN